MVVASGNWTRDADHVVKSTTNSDASNGDSEESGKMTAKGILICRENSHAFQERTLNLDQAVKIGRSVARARVATNNAIFDCKVLSRNHALLWYNAGKFYLQDTRSSNGTFVNNHRLSTTGLESAPREVCSGDIVQFGVDVMETTKKVTHGCIVATLKLYLPDGKEAKASRAMSIGGPAGDVSLEDLYKLNQYVQEASRREKVLQSKLSHLQTLVENTRLATDQSWKALIDEDRLLARVKTVESQLVACSKSISDDKIRNELVRLEEEKAQYQIAAKEALRKIHQEKLEVTQKLAQLESRLNETEEECQSLHDVSKHAQLELQELAAKYTDAQRNLQFMENKLVEKEESSSEIVKWAMQEKKDLLKKVEEQAKVERFLQARLRNCWLEDPVNIPKHIAAMRNYMQTLMDMNPKLTMDDDGDETTTTVKDIVNPIEAINSILNKLEAMLAEMNCDVEMINDTNIANSENDDNQTKTNETKSLLIENNDNYDKNELDDSPNKRNTRIGRLASSNDTRLSIINKNQQTRRTLVNGSANLDDSAESESMTNSNDDTSSIASDDTWIGFNDDSGEKSVIEMKQLDNDAAPSGEHDNNQDDVTQQTTRDYGQKLEVRFASGANGKDLEEVHYDHAYRPEEEFADVATAANDDDSSDSIESPNESLAATTLAATPAAISGTTKDTSDTQITETREDEADDDIEKIDCLELDDENVVDGDYIKTLKPLSDPSSPTQTREYILRTLINSLESLRGDDDHQAQREVRRELDELRDWLVHESSENIVNKLRELYYRAKNENQRVQEVNEELVILKEKYNAMSDEKTELLKQYKSLKAQCGDLLNTSYSVPIQYVAPIAAVIVWMLLEKMF